MRTFIALELSKEAIDEIKRIQELIRKKILFIGKFTEPENLHLTLKFLGEIDEKKVGEVKKRLREIDFGNFEAELADIGVFSKKFIKIVWIKLNGKKVFDLQREIDDKLKDLFEPEQRFMSHITIARVKNVKDRKELIEYLKNMKGRRVKFNVDGFFLKKSELFPEGPVYEVIENYKFSNIPKSL